MNEGESVRVQVVTPVHNRKELTLQCLRSLSKVDCTGIQLGIVVVDDGSSDGTGEAIGEEFPEVEIIDGDGTLWYTAGTNLGIERALAKQPDHILAINDDSVFESDFLQRMLQCAQDNPHAVVGALLLLADSPPQVFQVGAKWDTWYGGWRLPRRLTIWDVPRKAWEVEAIAGNCVLYPTDAIREVGLMNEKTFPHGLSDVDYSVRMRRAGWRLVIDPTALVWCQPNNRATPMAKLSSSQLLKVLLLDRRDPRNLVTLFASRWVCAPHRWEGLAAFAVSVVRMGFRRFGVGEWPDWPDPKIGSSV